MFQNLRKIMPKLKTSLYDLMEELGIDYDSYRGREDFLTITSTEDDAVVLISIQDEDHQILEVLWSK